MYLDHFWRNSWNPNSVVDIFTIIATFLLFYWFWKETAHKSYLFTVFVCLGVILSLWGLGQFIGWLPRTHGTFEITGPFDNPAGISASLVLLLPFSLYSSIYLPRKYHIFFILSICFTLAIIIISQARAAIFASIIIVVIFFIQYLKKNKHLKLLAVHYFLISSVCGIILVGLFFIKKDSATGRFLIWHCSGQLMAKAPLLGLGENGFNANYMNEQAHYFTNNPNSKFVMLADNVLQPFNEYLKHMIEYGIIGFLLIALLVLYPLYYAHKKKSMKLLTIQLGLLAIGICAMFSYPLGYPFIRLMVIIFIAFTMASAKDEILVIKNNGLLKIPVALCALAFLTATANMANCERKWKLIAHRSLAGHTEDMLSEYADLYRNTYFKRNESFLYNYGAELNHVGQYAESNRILSVCATYMNDYYLQMLMGNNYEQMENYRLAEKSFTVAHCMVPNRFIPLYLLVKLHEKNNNYTYACDVAEKIMHKDIKIQSMRIKIIKNEMEELISNYSDLKRD